MILRMISGAFVVPAMPPVHQQVQKRARKQQQIGQDPEEMGAALREQEERGNGEEGKKPQACSRAEPATLLRIVLCHYEVLLFSTMILPSNRTEAPSGRL
jgi:hypothetical protein